MPALAWAPTHDRAARRVRRRELALTPRRALVALHAAVALFGFAALFGKWIALPASLIVLGRTSIAAATLASAAHARGHRLARPSRGLVVNGAILALHWVTFFAAVQIATVAIGLLGYATFPLFVLLLERRLAPGKAHRPEWAIALLATAGLVALVPAANPSSATLQGLALGVASAFTFALLAVRNRALVERLPAVDIALWQNLFAALCVAPLAWLVSQGSQAPAAIDLALLVVLGVACTGLAHTLFIASMQALSAHTASIVAALEPVYGIALAMAFLGEIPDARTWIGGGMIVVAAIVASRRM
jgi:drug/metabolite transporter (DMT)-like permease